MKRLAWALAAAIIVSVLLVQTGCERRLSDDELPQYSIEQVLQTPEAFEGKLGVYGTGVVVYKDAKASIAVVVPESFTDFDVKNELGDDQVIPVKMDSVDFKLLSVGSLVKMRGTVEKAEKDRRVVRYIDAESAWTTGRVDIADPDFAKIVEVVKSEASDDDWFFTWFIIFIYLNPASPLSPFYQMSPSVYDYGNP